MRDSNLLTRCRKCRRPFASTADKCPDCHSLSPRGTRRIILKCSSVIVAVVSLATAFVFLLRSPQEPRPKGAPAPVLIQRAAEEGVADVSFARQ